LFGPGGFLKKKKAKGENSCKRHYRQHFETVLILVLMEYNQFSNGFLKKSKYIK